MKRRGQGTEHLVLYIMMAVVVILIFAFSFRALESGKQRAYDTSVIKFHTELDSDLAKIQRNFGSIVERSYRVHPELDEICLVDLDCSYLGDCWDFGNEIVEQMTAEDNNVYLLPEDGGLPIPFKMGDIDIWGMTRPILNQDDPVQFRQICFPTDRGTVHVQLEGAGTNTIVRPMWPTTDGTDIKLEPLFFCNDGTEITVKLPNDNTNCPASGEGTP